MGLLDLLISAEPDRRAGPLGRLLRPLACLACGAADAWPCCAACLPPEPAGPGPWRLAADPELTEAGAASPRLQRWMMALPRKARRLSHPPGMIMAMRCRSTRKTVYSAKYHLIGCPKYRRWVLVGGVDARLKAITPRWPPRLVRGWRCGHRGRSDARP